MAWVLYAMVSILAAVCWQARRAGVAAIVAVLSNAATTSGGLIAGLLAVAVTFAVVFGTVVALAQWGPDSLTPHALAADQITESRIEIVDPYVLVLSALAATALSSAAVFSRRSPELFGDRLGGSAR